MEEVYHSLQELALQEWGGKFSLQFMDNSPHFTSAFRASSRFLGEVFTEVCDVGKMKIGAAK